MAQIKSDRDIARDSNRAFVTGGPGHRKVEGDRQVGIISTAMNTGKTPAFPKRVYWGACKKSEWKTVGQNWPHVEEAKFRVWDEVLPPQMAPSDRYIIASTETLIPDDGEEYVCYGTIVYNTAYKEEKTTSWKHSVVRKGAVLETNALPGGYSSEWETKKNG